MNIDVRDLKGEVLNSMKRLIKELHFTSTAKATRFVIVDYFKIKEENQKYQDTIEKLRDEIEMNKEQTERDDKFRESFKSFLGI